MVIPKFRHWLQTSPWGVIFYFVVPGVCYATMMQLWDMWDGKDFVLWKFLARFVFFGLFGLVMREFQIAGGSKKEAQE